MKVMLPADAMLSAAQVVEDSRLLLHLHGQELMLRGLLVKVLEDPPGTLRVPYPPWAS